MEQVLKAAGALIGPYWLVQEGRAWHVCWPHKNGTVWCKSVGGLGSANYTWVFIPR